MPLQAVLHQEFLPPALILRTMQLAHYVYNYIEYSLQLCTLQLCPLQLCTMCTCNPVINIAGGGLYSVYTPPMTGLKHWLAVCRASNRPLGPLMATRGPSVRSTRLHLAISTAAIRSSGQRKQIDRHPPLLSLFLRTTNLSRIQLAFLLHFPNFRCPFAPLHVPLHSSRSPPPRTTSPRLVEQLRLFAASFKTKFSPVADMQRGVVWRMLVQYMQWWGD